MHDACMHTLQEEMELLLGAVKESAGRDGSKALPPPRFKGFEGAAMSQVCICVGMWCGWVVGWVCLRVLRIKDDLGGAKAHDKGRR